jgi:Ser-tRNA(Ala) deacylase AlaX
MTKKLFYEDPYMKEFDATVVSVNGTDIVLDQTAFYPFSGGQAPDNGDINGIAVVDVQKSGEDIVHVVEGGKLKENDKVHGKLDWNRRYTLMKLHTAAHIVYEIFTEEFGKQKIIGSNIHPGKARLDFEYPERLELEKVAERSNGAIAQGLEVETWEDPEKEGFRLWKAGEWEMPCGGTHVKNTSEIGKIKLKRENIGAGKERIEIKLVE